MGRKIIERNRKTSTYCPTEGNRRDIHVSSTRDELKDDTQVHETNTKIENDEAVTGMIESVAPKQERKMLRVLYQNSKASTRTTERCWEFG